MIALAIPALIPMPHKITGRPVCTMALKGVPIFLLMPDSRRGILPLSADGPLCCLRFKLICNRRSAAMKIGIGLFATAAVLFIGGCTGSTPTSPGGIGKLPHSGAMVLLPGGTYTMGSNDSLCDPGAQPPHKVTVSAFYIDTTPVTQASFQQIMGYNPASFPGDSLRPVESVSWFDAVLFCNARSKKDGFDTVYSYTGLTMYGTTCSNLANISWDLTRSGYRLPTEAEWEYACRAGTTTWYFWGDDSSLTAIGKYAWYAKNDDSTTQPVAMKFPNAFGLYDIVGNVWEMCNDYYGNYGAAAQTNPAGPATGVSDVLRGGSWGVDAFYSGINLRSAGRYAGDPTSGYANDGFRCARRQ